MLLFICISFIYPNLHLLNYSIVWNSRNGRPRFDEKDGSFGNDSVEADTEEFLYSIYIEYRNIHIEK